MRVIALLLLMCCGKPQRPPACGDAALLAAPADLGARGPWTVGARTVVLDNLTLEVWYPASGKPPAEAVRYDLRTVMPPAEAAKIPDAENAWLACDCYRDLPVDERHGPYPIVFFLHGAASFRAQSAFLATHWASRGFVVVAPDLPGVGLRAILGGEPTAYPLLVPNVVLDAIAKPRTVDPFAFMRAQMGARVAVVGHSLGAMLASTTEGRADVDVRIALAGFTTASSGSVLSLAGATDQIAKPNGDSNRLATAKAPSRSGIVRGAGHLAFTDLCTVGADRGGSLAIARAHGVIVPDMIATLAMDGCRPTDAPFAKTAPTIRAITTGVLEETLRCDATKAASIRALGASGALDLVEKID
ncbi:MAG: alpha/beta fold hydrolase [Myxococcota bacterium]|nr:alpha/beta fold hydrolase [Deltaproteobacteria bacterium]MDQ3334946.1 alpha/beta fold hydrolase [Myxococcota bacterium]